MAEIHRSTKIKHLGTQEKFYSSLPGTKLLQLQNKTASWQETAQLSSTRLLWELTGRESLALFSTSSSSSASQALHDICDDVTSLPRGFQLCWWTKMKCHPPDVRQWLAMTAWSYFFTTARGQTAQLEILVNTSAHFTSTLLLRR